MSGGGGTYEVAFVRQHYDAPPAETTAVRLLWLLRAHLPHELRVESERIRLTLAAPADGAPAGPERAMGDILSHRACTGWTVEC
ncbi:hypothetical protein [Streptomyces sp. MAR4 CNX-425]|uniref:hypothetical protein n=1 Tax=Streptomyces sp. MAR4 CNX-425 TaxID=3406343 RepID=UPI003B50C9CB